MTRSDPSRSRILTWFWIFDLACLPLVFLAFRAWWWLGIMSGIVWMAAFVILTPSATRRVPAGARP